MVWKWGLSIAKVRQLMCSFIGLHYLNSLVSFEHNLGVCLQNYPVIGRRNKSLVCFCRVQHSCPQSQISQKGDKKALPICLPLQKTGSSHPQSHVTIWSGHETLASQCIIWKCEEDKMPCLKPLQNVSKAQVVLYGWGLGAWVQVFLLLVFFVIMSKLHKDGARPGRIRVRQAQATL